MGFSPVQPTATIAGWATSGLGSVTVALPASVVDGDLVVVFIYSNASPGAFTAPSGYTISGSRIDFNGGSNAIYTHVWHTGDPTSVVFTSGGGLGNTAWLCCLARSRSAASIVSHTTTTTVVNSLNCPFTSFPPTVVGDLRLAFMTCIPPGGGLGSLTSPTVTASDQNPSALKFQEVIKIQNGGLSAALWYSLNEDPSGADANTVNWTSPSSVTYCTRSLVLDDGDGIAAAPGIEVAMFLADPLITAHAIEDGGPDGLSSAAGIFGGGAHIL